MTEAEWTALEEHPLVTIAANGSWVDCEASTGGDSR